MKRVAMMIAVLGISAWTLGQNSNTAAAPTAPAGQAAGQTTGQTAPPAGKRPPQAKTQDEYSAFQTATALTDAAAQEKAATDFASKYTDSELRPLLYKSVMHRYQQNNNADKMMEMAQKVLSFDPDDPEALVGVAQVIAEKTHEGDLDKDQRLAEAKKDAQHALETIDTDIPSSGAPADQLAALKAFLRSDAYEVLGTIDYNAKNWPDAETNLKKSIDAFPQQIDPVAVLRLALALDQESKYPEALKYANQSVDMTKEGTNVGDSARSEKDRLTKLTSGSAPLIK